MRMRGSSVVAEKLIDYYKVLGLDPDADPRAIRSAYRLLARRYHPDVAKGRAAARRFLVIQEAYEVLSDPEKRQAYDRLISTPPPTRHSPGRRMATPDRRSAASAESSSDSGFRLVIDALGILRLDVDIRVSDLSTDTVSPPRPSPTQGRRRSQK